MFIKAGCLIAVLVASFCINSNLSTPDKILDMYEQSLFSDIDKKIIYEHDDGHTPPHLTNFIPTWNELTLSIVFEETSHFHRDHLVTVYYQANYV
ncbi:hypothetical protein [Sutcliffiella rhizosphaerae]|uniref:Uncharacterized protein n=1 Tax=Sutcliffiella rhizosphaerae TaxID=2880967 RepID=A0ABM8YPB1_9BACI|nr:hypothetical protein [Sutcliffiella rhizosphaerae]CAG9621632.1 hypothetical protein BACCIP111883_02405 [Sutcliffiella rhizosphaerae]